MNQQGVTFLEIVVVIAILMITSALVAPSIQDWRQKRALEADFHAVLAQIDYLKVRARTLNGTALLKSATGQSNTCNLLTYEVSTNSQTETDIVVDTFATGLVEDPSSKNSSFNILSGNTKVVSDICNPNMSGIFIASGQTGVESNGNQIDIKIGPQTANPNLKDYRVLVNQSTGFVQKYKGSISNNKWTEID